MTDTEKQLLTHCPKCRRSLSIAVKRNYAVKDEKTKEVDVFLHIDCGCGWSDLIKFETIDVYA